MRARAMRVIRAATIGLAAATFIAAVVLGVTVRLSWALPLLSSPRLSSLAAPYTSSTIARTGSTSRLGHHHLLAITIAWLSLPPGYHHQLAITTANAFLSAFQVSSPKARHGLITRGVCGHRLITDDHHVHPPSSSPTFVSSHHHSARGRSIVSPLVSVFTAILMLGHAIAIFTGDHLHWHGQPCRQATIPSPQSPSLLVFCIKGRRAWADELPPDSLWTRYAQPHLPGFIGRWSDRPVERVQAAAHFLLLAQSACALPPINATVDGMVSTTTA